MKRPIPTLLSGFILILGLTLTGRAQPAAPLKDSLVSVSVTFQDHDPFLPWQKSRPGLRSGYATAIGSNLLLTTEGLVRNQTLIEVVRPESGTRVPARVLVADEQVDLAILRIPNPHLYGEFTPVPLQATAALTNPFTVVQFDDTARLETFPARFVQATVEELPNAPDHALVFRLLSEQNVNNDGAPVLQDGALAGIVIRYDSDNRTATVLPGVLLSRFIEDALADPYQGFAAAGFVWAPLTDPAKRAYLNVTEPGAGLLVQGCINGSAAAAVLAPNDVILSIAGHPVDNLGFYEDPDFGRLFIPYLTKIKHRPGESIPMTIVRDRVPQEVALTLNRRADLHSLIPENTTGKREPYIVEGGLILRELTGRYLKAYGNDWHHRVDVQLSSLYLTQLAATNPADRVIILSGVLADPINIGYQHLRDDIVTHVNGVAVQNLDAVFTVLERDQYLHRITLKGNAVDVVLDAGALPAANRRIADLYRIPALRRQTPLQE